MKPEQTLKGTQLLPDLTRGNRGTARWTTWLAWGIWALALAGLLVDGIFLALSRTTLHVNSWYALFVFLSYPTLGTLVARRQPTNPIGWLLSAMGLSGALLGASQAYAFFALSATPVALAGGLVMAWFQDWVWWLLLSLLPLVALLLPNGQLLSRRLRPVFLVASGNCVALTILGMFYPHALYLLPTLNNPFAFSGRVGQLLSIGFATGLLVLLVTFLTGCASLLLRFHRARGEERQQLKWIFSAFAVALLGLIIGPFLPEQRQPPIVWGDIVNGLGGIYVPVALGIAILRYRLWDIDIIINRTLIYGVLTATLAAIYVGLIIGLQSLVAAITGPGHQSPLVIVVSTLAIAALFQPLRRRIQILIDRRFYRHKYDAARTLETFSATLQNEVELGQLSEQLLAVVKETMQPTEVSLWLRPSQWRMQDQPYRLEAERAEPPSTVIEIGSSR